MPLGTVPRTTTEPGDAAASTEFDEDAARHDTTAWFER